VDAIGIHSRVNEVNEVNKVHSVHAVHVVHPGRRPAGPGLTRLEHYCVDSLGGWM
jgi:hypothetical protein